VSKWWVSGFNVVYQQFIVMYVSGCQFCCNWSRLKPAFNVQAHRSTMPQINMIPHPVTLNWHWANQPCSRGSNHRPSTFWASVLFTKTTRRPLLCVREIHWIVTFTFRSYFHLRGIQINICGYFCFFSNFIVFIIIHLYVINISFLSLLVFLLRKYSKNRSMESFIMTSLRKVCVWIMVQ